MREAAGESVGKKQKQRSDKGKTRKKTAGGKAWVGQHSDDNVGGEGGDIDEDEPMHQAKKHKIGTVKRKLPFAAKSQPFIDDSNLDGDSFEDA